MVTKGRGAALRLKNALRSCAERGICEVQSALLMPKFDSNESENTAENRGAGCPCDQAACTRRQKMSGTRKPYW